MRRISLGITLVLASAMAAGADSVNGFSGSFSQVVAVEVPAYRGIEPRLALGYSSQAGTGFAGVGWGLVGFSLIQRASPGLGSPRFDDNDVFVFDGRELLGCPPASTSPSCATGGSHTTKAESYLRIRFDPAANAWTVWSRNGTRTVFTPLFVTPSGTLSWGQVSTTDTHGNAVSYAWACDGGDCYPDQVRFGPYSVKLFREDRPDVLSFATGSATSLRQMRSRLRSVVVTYQGSPVRAYGLSYALSSVTGRSLLASVRPYGKDVVVDAAGRISSGTSLPPHVFEYQDDPAGKTFQRRRP